MTVGWPLGLFRVRPSGPFGDRVGHPRLMTKILLYRYCVGVFSSRCGRMDEAEKRLWEEVRKLRQAEVTDKEENQRYGAIARETSCRKSCNEGKRGSHEFGKPIARWKSGRASKIACLTDLFTWVQFPWNKKPTFHRNLVKALHRRRRPTIISVFDSDIFNVLHYRHRVLGCQPCFFLMMMLSVFVATRELASVTCTVKVLAPVPVGVPEITPVPGAKVNPAGKLPAVMDHV
jgi:hypothetical protein